MAITQFGLIEWLFIIFGVILLTLIRIVYFTPKSEIINDRIISLSNIAKGDEEEQNKNRSLSERLLLMIGNFIQPIFKKYKQKSFQNSLKMKLVRSGDNTTDAVQHWSKKILFGIVALLFGLFVGDYRMLLFATLIGFFYPDLKLKQNVDKRIGKIRAQVPNYIDLLSSTSASVSNLDEAIRIVCDRYDSEVSKEFRVVLGEISTGKRRRDALNDMADRLGIPEIYSLVSQINQSDVFGTPIQETLKNQAVKLRKIKRDLSEKKAANASTTLLLPGIFLLITIILVIMGPTIMQLTQLQQ